MRVMVMVKATKNSEAGILPGDPRAPEGFDKLFEKMGEFNAALVKAGVMLAGGEVVQYEAYRLCYIRGPEGLLIGLAQELG